MNKSMFETQLIEAFENDERVILTDAFKNGAPVKSVLLKSMSTNPAPTFYVNEIVERFYNTEECISVDNCVETIINELQETSIPEIKLPSVEEMFETATLRLLGNRSENNDSILFDVCGIPVVLNNHIKNGDMEGSYVIPKPMIDEYLKKGHTTQEIIDCACKNTDKTTVLFTLDPINILSGLKKHLNPDDCELSTMYVLTNEQKFFGASAMLSTFVPRLANNLKKDIYIFPSSVHEVILNPDFGTMAENEMKTMVRDINRTQVHPRDVLSDNVFRYSREKMSITIV